MSQTIDVQVPDIGDFKDVPVIEVLVKPGDSIKKNDSLITLESDKASMEIPSSADGTVADIKVKVGDKVSRGTPIVTLTSDAAQPVTPSSPPVIPSSAQSARIEGQPQSSQAVIPSSAQSARIEGPPQSSQPVIPSTVEGQAAPSQPVTPSGVEGPPQSSQPVIPSAVEGPPQIIELAVPDLGDFKDVPVVEVLIKPGDQIHKESSLVALESDKASMEVPSTAAGTVKDVRVKVGDKVSKGTVLATLSSAGATAAPVGGALPSSAAAPPESAPPPPATQTAAPVSAPPTLPSTNGARVHASPSIRRFARELGVELSTLRGSGPNGRITRDDVQNFVKSALQTTGAPAGTSFAGLPPWPKVDFAQYGEIERTPLSRIKKLSGPNLHRNWLQIPHITNYDEADVTDLEAFRKEINDERGRSGGAKLTMLAFLVKASVAALQQFPDFNASLDGDALVHKKYYNIGFAADTPNGLIVPVLKSADRKGLLEIAEESGALAAKAREGKLGLGDMQGGTFTISSIGGIGGTAFTQIVNAPEVAILGATRSAMKPLWDGKAFVPRLMLPISVSYDHRVIDGASAARFLVYLAGLLRDFRRVLL